MGSTSTTAPIRLAILETDTPVPGVNAKYVGYGGVFKHLFQRACETSKPPVTLESELDISIYHVVDDTEGVPITYPDPETIDAILITGSKYDSFKSDEWILRLINFTKRCLEGGRVRVIGVCFGHQIVGRAMGAKVERNPKGWELSVVEHELTGEGRKILGLDKLRIQQFHRDAVLDFPPGAIPLAKTAICANQGMCVPKRMISTQGHPEFTQDMIQEILDIRKDLGILTSDQHDEAYARAGNEQDGVAVAQAFVRFLRE